MPVVTFASSPHTCYFAGCKNPVVRTTREYKKDIGYCQEHVPDQVRSFQLLAMAAMLKGTAKRRKGQRAAWL